MLADEGIARLILELLPPNGRVLDVGCGGGHMLRALAKRGVEGVGIDPRPYGSSPCRRLRAEEITELYERFELVYAIHALHEFDAPGRFPSQARKVLRAKGILLIVDWVRGAKTRVRERYLAVDTVAGWVVDAGFDMLRQEIRGQKMILVGRLPAPRGASGPRAPRRERKVATGDSPNHGTDQSECSGWVFRGRIADQGGSPKHPAFK